MHKQIEYWKMCSYFRRLMTKHYLHVGLQTTYFQNQSSSAYTFTVSLAIILGHFQKLPARNYTSNLAIVAAEVTEQNSGKQHIKIPILVEWVKKLVWIQRLTITQSAPKARPVESANGKLSLCKVTYCFKLREFSISLMNQG